LIFLLDFPPFSGTCRAGFPIVSLCERPPVSLAEAPFLCVTGGPADRFSTPPLGPPTFFRELSFFFFAFNDLQAVDHPFFLRVSTATCRESGDPPLFRPIPLFLLFFQFGFPHFFPNVTSGPSITGDSSPFPSYDPSSKASFCFFFFFLSVFDEARFPSSFSSLPQGSRVGVFPFFMFKVYLFFPLPELCEALKSSFPRGLSLSGRDTFFLLEFVSL